MKPGLFLLICLTGWTSFAQAQPSAHDQLAGTWIGVHTEVAPNATCPLPIYIQLNPDSTYRLGLIDGTAAPIQSTWGVVGERVRLDTIHFAPKLISVQDNLLRIGKSQPMLFRRFNDVPLDSARVERQLVGRIWQSDSLAIGLYADGKVSLTHRASNHQTAHFWRLARFNHSIFLVIQGNSYNHDGGYKSLWQINTARPDQLQLIGWNDKSVAVETFWLAKVLGPGDSCRPSGFQTCENCFRRNPWAETSLNRSARRYDLNQLFTKYYQPLHLPGQSGLVRIGFAVNCQGESGLYVLKGFDTDYCPKLFDDRITRQLLTICREHIATDASIRATDDPDGRSKDVAISLTFRLRDGLLIDILP